MLHRNRAEEPKNGIQTTISARNAASVPGTPVCGPRMMADRRSAFEGTLDERLVGTLGWLQAKGLTRVGTDFRFSLDADLSQPTLLDPVLSWPLQRSKRRTRDEIKVLCATWKPKSENRVPTMTDAQWSALKDKRGSLFLAMERMPPDAIAFYRPFHIEPFDRWGIYVFVDRLLRYGSGVRLQLPMLRGLSESVFLHLVLFEMFHHEFFHHLVESAATTIEILASALRTPAIPTYLNYRAKVWARSFSWQPHQPLEEALANAYAYNSLGFISRVKTGYKDYLVGLYQAALKRHWLREPPGYREAENYISGGQVAGCTDLLAMMLGRSERAYNDELVRIASSVMPNGFTAYVSKPDIPTYFVGKPELVAKFYDLVPSPNETYCNLFWPIDTEVADKQVRERKARDDEARRRKALLSAGRKTSPRHNASAVETIPQHIP
jgi:hypothetical protein